jgi:hypothetical protein
MVREASNWGGRSVEVGWGLYDLLTCTRVFPILRWIMLEKVLGDVASWCWPYLVTNSSHAGGGVDGLACLRHYPTTCSHRRGDKASYHTLSYPIVQQWVVALYWEIHEPWAWILAEVLTAWVSVPKIFIYLYGFYQDKITLYWNRYDAHACIPDQVTISESDGMGPHTRVYTVMCV